MLTMPTLDLEIEGIDKVVAGLGKFPREVQKNMSQAGDEAANTVILDTKGLNPYPDPGPGNAPPYPYYVRHRGTQYSSGYNKGESEYLGNQWYVKAGAAYTEIGNRASYAKHVVGPNQASHMGIIGWRKLWEVAAERMHDITKVYQAWVNKTIRDLGL
jgi:hypothetical protein